MKYYFTFLKNVKELLDLVLDFHKVEGLAKDT